jgi:hypothetical protein
MSSLTQENTSINKGTNVKVVALAVICIVLAASLVGVIALYLPAAGNSDLQSQLTAKNAQITQLQNQIATLTASNGANSAGNVSEYILEITYLNQQLASLNSTLTDAYSNIDTMTQILNLQVTGQLYSDTFIQTPNTATTVWTGDWNYAGYVVVQAISTSNTTYAQVQYTVGGTSLSFNQTVGLSGTAILPVLTGTAKINLGNTNTIDSDTINATVTYYY